MVAYAEDPNVRLESIQQELPAIESKVRKMMKTKTQIVWTNVVLFVILHAMALNGLLLAFTSAKLLTVIWCLLVGHLSALGVTAGAHRLWTHRAYKATWQLKTILVIFNTISGQNSLHEWIRDHRQHHKFTDTPADPHDSTRGFFFSHIGWLMMRKLPEVKAAGKTMDMKDIEEDSIVMFQKKYYIPLYILLAIIFPVSVPCLLWGESVYNSFYISYALRYAVILNGTWLINSAAHMWGFKPYDKFISAVECMSIVSFTVGEGWHNYHHAFPWDYKASELGLYRTNITTAFIDFFVWLGWAYDLKTASPEMIKSKVLRSGDGTHPLWGFGDKDLPEEEWKKIENAQEKKKE